MTEECIELRGGRERVLALFAGGDLTTEESAAMEAHLAGCRACRSFVDGLRESRAGLAALAGEPVDPEALGRIRRAVRRRIEAEAVRRERSPAWALALAAGLALALVAAAVWLRGGAPGGAGPSPGGERVAGAPDPAPAELPLEPAPDPTPPAPPAGRAGGDAPGASAQASPAPRSAAPDQPAPTREGTRQAAAVPAAPVDGADPAPAAATEPMVIQVVSDDPDIVFYWLVEPEETDDETVSS